MNVSLEIFMIILVICGLIMLLAGWRSSINANDCPNTEKSAVKSARTSLAVGTVLFTASLFYFCMLVFYSNSSKILMKMFNKDSETKKYIIMVIFVVLGITGISLASVIMNGTGTPLEDPNIEEEQKKVCQDACSKLKSSGTILLIPSIAVVILCLIYFYFFMYKK